MWISTVLFAVVLVTASGEPHPKLHSPKSFPGRNQRIIKVQGPPHYNHFHGHHKPIRSRPYGVHHREREEFIRPNHPPPIPPFFNGPSTNHIKHPPRPPPHVYHKLPSYGLGFPYKSWSNFRPPVTKDHFRVQSLSTVRPSASVATAGPIKAASGASFHSPTFAAPSFLSSPPVGHIISSDDNNGPIHEIPAPNLAPKPHHDGGSYSSVAQIESDAFVSTIASDPGVDVNAIVKDPGIDVNAYIKQSGGDLSYGKGPTVEIANFDEGSSLDVTNLIKEAAVSGEHNSGYQVTEHHNHLPSNDQIIKGHDGTKLYYAPDPDPSLPVHKVPPTSDPHSTPSNGQGLSNVYLPQIAHGFPYVQGAPVGAPVGSLSSHELFQLMHGIHTVPVVTFVGQPQPDGVFLGGGGGGGGGGGVQGQSYYQQGSGQYSEPGQYGNDIGHYLSQPDIHNLLHNTPESHHEQESLGASHSSLVSHDNYPQQSTYSPQNQYQGYIQAQYQTNYKNTDSNSDTTNAVVANHRYATSEINHNYQYEPEASESKISNSLTVIRQTNEGNLNSETVKELLLEDSAANELNYQDNDATPESVPTILQLKNIPEVPFYASLPNKKAAEALATLQAAGSVANNYMNKIKITRGDQGPDTDESEARSRKIDNSEFSQITKPPKGNFFQDESVVKGETAKLGTDKVIVEIQESVPLYEGKLSEEDDSEFSSDGQDEEDLSNVDINEDDSKQTFGKRIRPK